MLEEKLKQVDCKYKELSEILMKKSSKVPGKVIYEDKILVGQNQDSISSFKMPLRTVTILPRIDRKLLQSQKADAEPSPVDNLNILRIRHEHLQKTIGRHAIDQRIKAKKEREDYIIQKSKPRDYPKVVIPPSMFPNRYTRGELPCTIEHGINGHYLSWACPLENLDYEFYLPIFFDGLQCKDHPISFLARQGVEDMLYACKGYPKRVISCLQSLCRPLRNALSKYDPDILLPTLKVIQQLCQCNPEIGPQLLKYTKIFLSPMGTFLTSNRNIGDSIDYGQRKNDDIGEEVLKTLEIMEETGGPNAFPTIRFSIPLYQSCLKPLDFRSSKK